ncbi:MAG: hypothetical protein VX255_20405 [Candidatus Latescibacterota bacterium]|nr:hypothetical protein [Candidatus Latescibacterota bacterium]
MAYLLLSTFFIEAGLRQLGALHLSFVGGFVLMTFIIASRARYRTRWLRTAVAGPSPVADDSPRPDRTVYAGSIGHRCVPRQLCRVAGRRGGLWVLGVAIWGLVFMPKMLPHHVAPD